MSEPFRAAYLVFVERDIHDCLRSARQAEAARGDHVAGDIETAGGKLEIEVVAILGLDFAIELQHAGEPARSGANGPSSSMTGLVEQARGLALDQQRERGLMLRVQAAARAARRANSS